jgi:hypothetical protein
MEQNNNTTQPRRRTLAVIIQRLSQERIHTRMRSMRRQSSLVTASVALEAHSKCPLSNQITPPKIRTSKHTRRRARDIPRRDSEVHTSSHKQHSAADVLQAGDGACVAAKRVGDSEVAGLGVVLAVVNETSNIPSLSAARVVCSEHKLLLNIDL